MMCRNVQESKSKEIMFVFTNIEGSQLEIKVIFQDGDPKTKRILKLTNSKETDSSMFFSKKVRRSWSIGILSYEAEEA